MKRLLRSTVLLYVLLSIGLACRKAEPVVSPTSLPPVVVAVPKDTMASGSPQILAITIGGIPKENITIDQTTRLITVVVPEVPEAVQAAISTTITNGFSLYPAGNPYTYKFNLYLGNSSLPLYDAKNNLAATYKLTLKQTRPLAIGPASQPLVLLTGSPLTIPVENFYENSNGATAILTNTQTGQQLKGSIDGLVDSNSQLYIANQFQAFFDADLPPGTYTLDLVKNNGRQARSPQLVTILRGLPGIDFNYWYPFNTFPGGQGVRGVGVNLYGEDQIELLLTNRSGQSYKLTPTSYAANGQQSTLDLPADLPPMPYTIQLIRRGQPVDSYSRLVVRKDINQPAIESFGNLKIGVAPTQMIVLQRGRVQVFTLLYSPGVAKVRLRFKAVNNASGQYLIDAAHTEGYLSFGPDAGYPDFTLPQSVLPGRYTVSLQHVLRDGSVVEGEPLERDVEVQ